MHTQNRKSGSSRIQKFSSDDLQNMRFLANYKKNFEKDNILMIDEFFD